MFKRNSILLLCSLLLPYGEARCEGVEEQGILEGTWKFVSTTGGNSQNKEKRAHGGMVFKGESVSFIGDRDKVFTQGTFTVDKSKNPKTMDITLEKNGARVITRTIYEVDGDTLKICHYLGAMASKERPKEFMSDEHCVIGILKREIK